MLTTVTAMVIIIIIMPSSYNLDKLDNHRKQLIQCTANQMVVHT